MHRAREQASRCGHSCTDPAPGAGGAPTPASQAAGPAMPRSLESSHDKQARKSPLHAGFPGALASSYLPWVTYLQRGWGWAGAKTFPSTPGNEMSKIHVSPGNTVAIQWPCTTSRLGRAATHGVTGPVPSPLWASSPNEPADGLLQHSGLNPGCLF